MSYVTVQEADAYVNSHYLATDRARVYWSTLDDTSKSVLLQRAFERIERLPFTSRKASYKQTTQFPRYPLSTVPQAVKDANVVEAIHSSSAFPEQAEQQAMRMRGVKSYSIGQLSETFEHNRAGGYGNPMDMICVETLVLLRPYMSGGYRICT